MPDESSLAPSTTIKVLLWIVFLLILFAGLYAIAKFTGIIGG